ncbi:MAG: glycerophosphodiester phosphodiesterase family protein [Chloroflexota bacterium]
MNASRLSPKIERPFLRIGHRGASAYAPENTLASFIKAAELGANMVELDVQLSADGIPVIIHDAELSRSTNGQGQVADYSLAELKQLDAGQGEQIPTLQEAIDCCLSHHLGLYIELKSGAAISTTVELIQSRRLYSHVIIGSFRPDWVAQVKHLAPQIETSILFGAVHLDPVKLAQAIQADYVHPCWEKAVPAPHVLLTPEWVTQVRAANLGIICWHEERITEIMALKSIGVDGICSDTPDLLVLDDD